MPVLEIRDEEGGVRVLTLARPRANVFDVELMTALSNAVRAANEEGSVRALVVTGSGSMFSAGLDFKALMAAMMSDPGATDRFGRAMEQAFLDLWTSAKPTVAAVNGHAIAAGYLVAIACDHRLVVAGDGRYGLNELVWGAGFPTVAIELARSVLGPALTEVLLGAELFDAAQGVANGSFAAICDDHAALLAAAIGRARELGARPHAPYAHAKALLQAPFVERAPAARAVRERMAAASRSPETMAALSRYLGELGRRRGS